MDWNYFKAGIYRARSGEIRGVKELDTIKFSQLLGIERQKEEFIANIENFLADEPFNHVLLWGARGTGKSSLVKALANEYDKIKVIEFSKDDLIDLPYVVDGLRSLSWYFVIFCDDLSFDDGEFGYKGLKPVLDGSIELPPKNVLICATSNRRHLVSEHAEDNLHVEIKRGELHYGDEVEEKISLSDRFGLWLSFYHGDQDEYLEKVEFLFKDFDIDPEELKVFALRFAQTRASRSGRTAKQFFNAYKTILVGKK